MSDTPAHPQETTSNLGPREIVALLLIAGGVLTAVAVDARGMATAIGWASIFAGMALGFASKSVVVRVGGAFIASLVVILVVALLVRKDAGEPAAASNEEAALRDGSPAGPPKSSPSRTSTGDADALATARKLGGGDREARAIGQISRKYGADVTTVGDKAAKAAELCLGGRSISDAPTEAMQFATASLAFVNEASADAATREMLPLTDAFATFVAVGCPR